MKPHGKSWILAYLILAVWVCGTLTMLLFGFSVFISCAGETNALPTTFTVDGIAYSNVTWRTVTSSTVSIIHSTGAATIPLEKLSTNLQKRFHFDPVKAAADQKRLEAARTAKQEANLCWGGEIHDAALKGDMAKVKGLLKDNPDLARSNDDFLGDTPLHYAAKDGHKDVAELLLANKAEVDAKDNSGWTPLHAAAFNGHKEVAKLLLAHGADVNAKDSVGETPLGYAVLGCHRDVAELLLTNKAKVNSKDNLGFTPLDGALERDEPSCKDVVTLLRQHGGHE
jgi:hypothetical protein